MIKLSIKCLVVFMAFQSVLNYLQKEEIVKGSIEINYPVIKQKIFSLMPTAKISHSIVQFASTKVADAKFIREQPREKFFAEPLTEESPLYKIVTHIVADGETLIELGERYGVHWRVIQKVNHIPDEQMMYVGQILKIPSKVKIPSRFSI